MLENKLADKLWRMHNLYYIQTKDSKLIPMPLNNAQRDYLSKRGTRNYILKARQLGFSTLGLIDLLDETIYNKNVNSAVICHEKQKVIKLFEIIKRAYEHLPDDSRLKPRVSIENRNELYFPDIGSKIYVTMDTRGETVHNLHVSELAFISNSEQRLAATLESVPKGGRITYETTANGMANYAFTEWNDPHSEYHKFFYNWLWDDDYRLSTDKTREQLEDEYRALAIEYELIEDAPDRYGLDDEQLAFYISKVRRHRKLVLQEYPFNDTEAFIASGLGVFAASDLGKHEPIEATERKWTDCLIWEKPLQGFKYVVGVDSSEGLGQDNAVIQVLNASTGFQAAEFASPNVPPDQLASYVLSIAKWYNNALIVPEINSSGISLVDHLKTKYVNIYKREVFDKRAKETREVLGWRTTATTKPILVHDLEEAVREEDIQINSKETLAEMQTFVRTTESGLQGYGAEGTNKDDRVIALGLALQGIKWQPRMKKPESVAQQKLREYIEKKNLSKQFGEEKATNILKQRQQRYKIRGQSQR
jgi:hypothetical protein